MPVPVKFQQNSDSVPAVFQQLSSSIPALFQQLSSSIPVLFQVNARNDYDDKGLEYIVVRAYRLRRKNEMTQQPLNIRSYAKRTLCGLDAL